MLTRSILSGRNRAVSHHFGIVTGVSGGVSFSSWNVCVAESAKQRRDVKMMQGISRNSSTAAKHPPSFTYFSAWFCPFAHRATLALEHHGKLIDYEWVESLGWEKRTNTDGATDSGKDWMYHWKSEELMKVNPLGMVPTLLSKDNGKVVSESIVTIEFLDNLVKQTYEDIPQTDFLIPHNDCFEIARTRVWSDKVNRELCSPYYSVLVKQDKEEQKVAFTELLQNLDRFSRELEKTSGPLFLENNQLSVVDMTVFPWAWRYYVFEHYRGEQFAIRRDKEYEGYDITPFHDWLDAMLSIDSVVRTLPDKERYLEHIGKYADGSARSKVAEAVRRGVSAHEYDDEKDKY